MIYITADLHFCHHNVIKYCNRPFTDVNHMNKTLIKNWNNTVSDDDTVFILGDLSLKNTRKCFKKLNGKLNGSIVMIKGIHDSDKKYPDHCIIRYKGIPFYLIHNPKDIPKNWTGWSIHGHHHNKLPIINFDVKQFNVSVEMTDYRPISLNLIYTIINNPSLIDDLL